MTDMAWPLILQQTSQDLFPWQWLLFSQELKSIKKGKYESTIISQFSACVVFATILLAEARYMANSMEKWGNRLFLDRQTFKIIFQGAHRMGLEKFMDIFNISDNLIVLF